MKKEMFFLLLLAFTISKSFAQTTFQQVYGGIGMDEPNGVIQTADGGYIISGNTANFGPGTSNIYLVKTNATGDQQWAKTFGGALVNGSSGFVQTYDGGFAIAGGTTSFGAGDDDFYLVKTDVNGDTLWSKTYGRTGGDEYAYSIQQTSDSGFILVGETSSFGSGGMDIFVVKTNSIGDTLWTKAYGGTGDEIAFCVLQASDGGYLIGGYTTSFGITFDNVYIIKTDAEGNVQWSNTYGGSGQERAFVVNQVADRGFIVGGYSTSFGGSSGQIYMFKTDSTGGVLWSKVYGQGTAHSIQPTMDGGYVITGNKTRAGGADVYIIKTDAVGDTLWTRLYGGSAQETGYYIQQTSDSGFVVAGSTRSFGSGNEDYYLIKTDANGNVSCNEHDTTFVVGSPATQTTSPATITSISDTVVVSSVTTQVSGGIAETTVCLTVGVNEVPKDNIISLFPNPAHDEISLTLVSELEKGSLVIYNMLGEKIVGKEFNSNDSVVNVKTLSAGLYLLYITNERNRWIGKFVKE